MSRRAAAARCLAAAALAAALACAAARPGGEPRPTPGAAAGPDAEADAALAEADRRYAERRLAEARDLLARLGAREDLPPAVRVRALTDAGVVALEGGDAPGAEQALQAAVRLDREAAPGAAGDRYYPAKALFYLGEVARARFDALPLDPGDGDEGALTQRLDEKSTRLLEAQQRYLAAVDGGDPRWGVAAGARIGGLYEALHREVLAAPPPRGLGEAGDRAYRAGLRERVRVLATKAVEAYEGTLEAARRHEVRSEFVDDARAGLERMRRELAGPPESRWSPRRGRGPGLALRDARCAGSSARTGPTCGARGPGAALRDARRAGSSARTESGRRGGRAEGPLHLAAGYIASSCTR